MHRTLHAALPMVLLAASPAAALPGPSAAEVADTRQEFVNDALRTLSDRSGDLFYLPHKYSFVTAADPRHPRTGHVMVNGKLTTVTGPGISHGAPWTYDRDIPLVMWGPGFIKAGQRVTRRTQQQDLTPTYAQLIGSPLPSDARGHVLSEALLPSKRHPKVVFTMVFDQAGEGMYRFHPGATPFIDRLKREGTYFANTRVSHLDLETAMGHVAIGTGAFPMDHGIPSNSIWNGGAGADFNEFTSFNPPAPYFMMSPTLGDFWLRATHNQANVFSYCWVDRAAMGMGGHGSFYRGNKKPPIFWLNQDTGKLETNPAFYEVPAYLADSSPLPYAAKIAGPNGLWMEHELKDTRDLIPTPALPMWEGDNLTKAFDREPLGQDDVPDLVYVTLKSTDLAGHLFGQESEEVGAILHEQDHQFERLFEQLVKKVGRDNIVVTLTADHGGPPLPELSGGHRLYKKDLIAALNARFDKNDDGMPLVTDVSDTQVWLDHAQMRANHVSQQDLLAFLKGYQLNGQPFFDTVITRDELLRMRLNGKTGL